METKKSYKTIDSNRAFQDKWIHKFAVIHDAEKDLPVCILCGKVSTRNHSTNVSTHFLKIHADFAEEYPIGRARTNKINEILGDGFELKVYGKLIDFIS